MIGNFHWDSEWSTAADIEPPVDEDYPPMVILHAEAFGFKNRVPMFFEEMDDLCEKWLAWRKSAEGGAQWEAWRKRGSYEWTRKSQQESAAGGE
jgi:hypothetical protein